jgi:hypothetical protein
LCFYFLSFLCFYLMAHLLRWTLWAPP